MSAGVQSEIAVTTYRTPATAEAVARPEDLLDLDVHTLADRRQALAVIPGVVVLVPLAFAGFAADLAWLSWTCLALSASFASYGYWRHRNKRKLRIAWEESHVRVRLDEHELEFPVEICAWQSTRETNTPEGDGLASSFIHLRLTDRHRRKIELQQRLPARMADWSDAKAPVGSPPEAVFVVSCMGAMKELLRVAEKVNSDLKEQADREERPSG